MDNEVSGSREALAVTLVKIIKINIKATVNIALKYKHKTKMANNKIITDFVRFALERRALKQEIDSASTTFDDREFHTGIVWTSKKRCLKLIRTFG